MNRRILALALAGSLLAASGGAWAKPKNAEKEVPPPLNQWSHQECVAAWSQLSGPSEMADLRSALLKKFDERCMPADRNECVGYRSAADAPNVPDDLRVVLMRKFERGC